MLTFHYEPDSVQAAGRLAERLRRELGTKDNVVWLLSGGSNIDLEVGIVKLLPAELLPKLTCLLTDERYGLPGHADSNWQQLADAGFMARDITFPAVLVPDMTLPDTASHYATVVGAAFQSADSIIGQLGIGGDGHIAGILPRSAGLEDNHLVVSYDAGLHQRITMTPLALRYMAAAYAFAYGPTKQQALRHLQQDLPASEQPAQLLKQLAEAHVFSDQIEPNNITDEGATS